MLKLYDIEVEGLSTVKLLHHFEEVMYDQLSHEWDEAKNIRESSYELGFMIQAKEERLKLYEQQDVDLSFEMVKQEFASRHPYMDEQRKIAQSDQVKWQMQKDALSNWHPNEESNKYLKSRICTAIDDYIETLSDPMICPINPYDNKVAEDVVPRECARMRDEIIKLRINFELKVKFEEVVKPFHDSLEKEILTLP